MVLLELEVLEAELLPMGAEAPPGGGLSQPGGGLSSNSLCACLPFLSDVHSAEKPHVQVCVLVFFQRPRSLRKAPSSLDCTDAQDVRAWALIKAFLLPAGTRRIEGPRHPQHFSTQFCRTSGST